MHIAITGTHGIGKTTLLRDLIDARPDFHAVAEPFEMFEVSDAFVDGPNLEDFERQLEQSCELILSSRDESCVIFDRCPLDFIAYLEAMSEAEGQEWMPSGKQLARIEPAMQMLDLIVFVPLPERDEIAGSIEYPKLRRDVDQKLKTMLEEDEFGFLDDGLAMLDVSGTREKRVAKVVARLAIGG